MDQQAWERLVRLYGPLVYGWCRQAGLQAADAADIGQEVFLAVARKITAFHRDRKGDTFRGWLRVITRNKIQDSLRARQGVGMTGALKEAPTAAPASEDEGDHHGRNADDVERKVLCARAVELIRPEFEAGTWQAFWRVVIEDHSPGEVAKELAMSVNAVYLAKSRVLRRLRQEFADIIEEFL